jgi:hypothetical protein
VRNSLLPARRLLLLPVRTSHLPTRRLLLPVRYSILSPLLPISSQITDIPSFQKESAKNTANPTRIALPTLYIRITPYSPDFVPYSNPLTQNFLAHLRSFL